jgi:exodeoxyribonuclease VII large subunit
LQRATSTRLKALAASLGREQANLAHLNPESVLQRGYSIAYTVDGAVVRNTAQVDMGDTLRVVFAKGWSRARVEEKGEG